MTARSALPGRSRGYGNLVIVDHGAQTFSSIRPARRRRRSSAARESNAGSAVGTAGRMLAGIPGMYFEMRVDGKPVDPLEWLKKKP